MQLGNDGEPLPDAHRPLLLETPRNRKPSKPLPFSPEDVTGRIGINEFDRGSLIAALQEMAQNTEQEYINYVDKAITDAKKKMEGPRASVSRAFRFRRSSLSWSSTSN